MMQCNVKSLKETTELRLFYCIAQRHQKSKTKSEMDVSPFWLSMTKLPSSLPAVILYVIPSPSGSLASTVATRVLGPASSETKVRYLFLNTQTYVFQDIFHVKLTTIPCCHYCKTNTGSLCLLNAIKFLYETRLVAYNTAWLNRSCK